MSGGKRSSDSRCSEGPAYDRSRMSSSQLDKEVDNPPSVASYSVQSLFPKQIEKVLQMEEISEEQTREFQRLFGKLPNAILISLTPEFTLFVLRVTFLRVYAPLWAVKTEQNCHKGCICSQMALLTAFRGLDRNCYNFVLNWWRILTNQYYFFSTDEGLKG